MFCNVVRVKARAIFKFEAIEKTLAMKRGWWTKDRPSKSALVGLYGITP
jgi:hypothetical protein